MINYLNKLDQNIFLWINQFHSDSLNPLMVFISGQIIWIPFVAFFLFKGFRSLPKKRFYLFLLFLALTIFMADVFSSYILKNSFTRLRPCRINELKPLIYHFGQKCGGKFGFVSSHAANSVALVYFCLKSLRLSGSFQFIWALPVLVSYSRMYLGVHFPGDILGGTLVGLLMAWVMSSLFLRTREQV